MPYLPPGKTGADAISQKMNNICRTITRYRSKLLAAITALVALGLLSSTEAATMTAWIEAADTMCALWQKVADASGFNS